MNQEILLENYLTKIYKKSTGSFHNNKSILLDFFKTIKKPISKIDMFDVINYFDTYIDKEPIKLSTKNTRRYTLKAFFNYVKKQYLNEHVIYTNPVPDKDIYQFTKKITDITRQSKKKLPILSHKQIEAILKYWEHKNERNFILFMFAICTGARISEIRTLKINDIALPDRYFETGFEVDARKTTLHSEESLLFFFPKELLPYLHKYMINMDLLVSKTYLFFSKRNPDQPLSHDTAQYICRKTSKALGFKFTWHYFRKTIITERMKNGCHEWLSEGLSNHKGTTVERENYIHLSIPEKREMYDEYFPYKDISFFQKEKI